MTPHFTPSFLMPPQPHVLTPSSRVKRPGRHAWAIPLVRPKRRKAACLVLALATLGFLASSWARVQHNAVLGQQTKSDLLSIDELMPLYPDEMTVYGGDNVGELLDHDAHSVHDPKTDAEIRQEFEEEYTRLGEHHSPSHKLYGGTLASLIAGDAHALHHAKLTPWPSGAQNSLAAIVFGGRGRAEAAAEGAGRMYGRHAAPYAVDPYPAYNSRAWRHAGHAPHVPCDLGPLVDAPPVAAFVGLLRGFPQPSFGSYAALGLDADLCYERDTRLGIYAIPIEDNVEAEEAGTDWGALQRACVQRNAARFDLRGPANTLAQTLHGPLNDHSRVTAMATAGDGNATAWMPWWAAMSWPPSSANASRDQESKTTTTTEPRTAVLLRAYTGKQYTEDDRLVLRALVAELVLRTGGAYEVFLLVHVKEEDAAAVGTDLADGAAYAQVLAGAGIPEEFQGMALLWSDAVVRAAYPRLARLAGPATNVHEAQWLSVQLFAQAPAFRAFAHVWNWELDVRAIGHAFALVDRLAAFARAQPRRELWERSARFFLPGVHGADGYDTVFRRRVAKSTVHSVWGPPDVEGVRPVGPEPPVARPEDDVEYAWGVGQEADLIALSPLFDPRGSGWVLGDQVWGYGTDNDTDDGFRRMDELPRRAAIVTHCRLSRTLLDAMHVENLRGNHVSSEMAPATVALLHGLKAVYAPIPVVIDRPWPAARLARWFNNANGTHEADAGGSNSPMGWGREGRFRGSTWYYRAEPPQRLYHHWSGYEDGGKGGLAWESAHGRPCLPALLLHPVKDVVPTAPGFRSESRLPYA